MAILSKTTYQFPAISEAERHTHKMHILGKFCRKNLMLVIKKQFSCATKGLSQDGKKWKIMCKQIFL
jgi:hypothetical protein